MKYARMPIEAESPEQLGYGTIRCNLAESSVSDAVLGNLDLDLGSLLICYGDHYGKPELRDWVAHNGGMEHRDEVLITVGAAAGLFIIATTLLEKESHLIVVRPNYATNIETPRAIGCQISFVDLKMEDNFSLKAEEIENLIRPTTRLISITSPHNPTGTVVSDEEINKLIVLAEKHNCYLLVDETYRELNFNAVKPLFSTLNEKVISVSSVSKAYGLPGLRVGWVCTKDKTLMEKLLSAKEQIFVCNSVVDEEIAFQFLYQREEYMGEIKQRIDKNFETLKKWIQSNPYMEWVEPGGGVVCFPRIKIQIDTAEFYRILYNDCQTMVGPGHWFEMDDHFMRIGFGWEKPEQFKEGLMNISRVIEKLSAK